MNQIQGTRGWEWRLDGNSKAGEKKTNATLRPMEGISAYWEEFCTLLYRQQEISNHYGK